MVGKVIRSEALIEAHPVPELIRSGAFSAAVRAGPSVYISGCIANDLTKSMGGQTEEIFEYMSLALSEEGFSMADVVKLQAFITDVEQYGEYSAARKKYFPGEPPASTTVIAGIIIPGALIEIEAVAYKE
ncbi:RidA family protein [Candidatus Poriferisodalis sp.]|uniref:RidA family protein n=1 Tax=Candidatus Poriferisodalis sp. TaxID=3101277 RepID=UPI003B51A53E